MGKIEKTLTLVRACGWLIIKEKIKHQSLLLMWKIIWMKAHLHLHMAATMDQDHYISTQEPQLLG